MEVSITHVIFDFNGTLINTIDNIYLTFNEIAMEYGKDLSKEIRDMLENKEDTWEVLFMEFIGQLGLDANIDKKEFVGKVFSRVVEKVVHLKPGVEKFLKHLHAHNISMAIASSSRRKDIEFGLSRLEDPGELMKYFSHVVCGKDDPEVTTNKPDPQIYLICVKRFATQPDTYQNVLVVEDSFKGITGAMATGMKTLLVTDSGYENLESIAEKTTFYAKTFEEVDPESIGLPPY